MTCVVIYAVSGGPSVLEVSFTEFAHQPILLPKRGQNDQRLLLDEKLASCVSILCASTNRKCSMFVQLLLVFFFISIFIDLGGGVETIGTRIIAFLFH